MSANNNNATTAATVDATGDLPVPRTTAEVAIATHQRVANAFESVRRCLEEDGLLAPRPGPFLLADPTVAVDADINYSQLDEVDEKSLSALKFYQPPESDRLVWTEEQKSDLRAFYRLIPAAAHIRDEDIFPLTYWVIKTGAVGFFSQLGDLIVHVLPRCEDWLQGVGSPENPSRHQMTASDRKDSAFFSVPDKILFAMAISKLIPPTSIQLTVPLRSYKWFDEIVEAACLRQVLYLNAALPCVVDIIRGNPIGRWSGLDVDGVFAFYGALTHFTRVLVAAIITANVNSFDGENEDRYHPNQLKNDIQSEHYLTDAVNRAECVIVFTLAKLSLPFNGVFKDSYVSMGASVAKSMALYRNNMKLYEQICKLPATRMRCSSDTLSRDCDLFYDNFSDLMNHMGEMSQRQNQIFIKSSILAFPPDYDAIDMLKACKKPCHVAAPSYCNSINYTHAPSRKFYADLQENRPSADYNPYPPIHPHPITLMGVDAVCALAANLAPFLCDIEEAPFILARLAHLRVCMGMPMIDEQSLSVLSTTLGDLAHPAAYVDAASGAFYPDHVAGVIYNPAFCGFYADRKAASPISPNSPNSPSVASNNHNNTNYAALLVDDIFMPRYDQGVTGTEHDGKTHLETFISGHINQVLFLDSSWFPFSEVIRANRVIAPDLYFLASFRLLRLLGHALVKGVIRRKTVRHSTHILPREIIAFVQKCKAKFLENHDSLSETESALKDNPILDGEDLKCITDFGSLMTSIFVALGNRKSTAVYCHSGFHTILEKMWKHNELSIDPAHYERIRRQSLHLFRDNGMLQSVAPLTTFFFYGGDNPEGMLGDHIDPTADSKNAPLAFPLASCSFARDIPRETFEYRYSSALATCFRKASRVQANWSMCIHRKEYISFFKEIGALQGVSDAKLPPRGTTPLREFDPALGLSGTITPLVPVPAKTVTVPYYLHAAHLPNNCLGSSVSDQEFHHWISCADSPFLFFRNSRRNHDWLAQRNVRPGSEFDSSPLSIDSKDHDCPPAPASTPKSSTPGSRKRPNTAPSAPAQKKHKSRSHSPTPSAPPPPTVFGTDSKRVYSLSPPLMSSSSSSSSAIAVLPPMISPPVARAMVRAAFAYPGVIFSDINRRNAAQTEFIRAKLAENKEYTPVEADVDAINRLGRDGKRFIALSDLKAAFRQVRRHSLQTRAAREKPKMSKDEVDKKMLGAMDEILAASDRLLEEELREVGLGTRGALSDDTETEDESTVDSGEERKLVDRNNSRAAAREAAVRPTVGGISLVLPGLRRRDDVRSSAGRDRHTAIEVEEDGDYVPATPLPDEDGEEEDEELGYDDYFPQVKPDTK